MPERAHPRYDLAAQVEVSTGDEVLIFRARNASKGGLFLETNPADHPGLAVGMQVTIYVCHIEEVDHADAEPTTEDVLVRAQASIVRVEKAEHGKRAGFAVQFSALTRDNEQRLERLVARARRSSEAVTASS
jgi:hypothetical protein